MTTRADAPPPDDDTRPHILVTNDDGIGAPGLAALAAALREVGRVSVVAPDKNWSASGHVKTLHKPLRVHPARMADGSMGLSTSGAPSDCVALAVLGVAQRPIDLVVSGINPVANLGHDITYSGTVTSAMEAAVWGIPGIAVSRENPPGHAIDVDYGPAARLAVRLARVVLERGLPPNTLLNLNVPDRPEHEIAGVRLTRQGLREYLDELDVRVDPRGRTYYWYGGEEPGGVREDGTDIAAIQDGFASITPLRLDLTARDVLESMRGWGLER
jgi:5'-nucleotidase